MKIAYACIMRFISCSLETGLVYILEELYSDIVKKNLVEIFRISKE